MTAVDRLLFAFACYNGGPNRIAACDGKAAAQGLDPNAGSRTWRSSSPAISAGRRRSTSSNIFKYYVAYKRLVEELEARKAARERAIENAGDR